MTSDELIQILTDETNSGAITWANPKQGDYETTRRAGHFTLTLYSKGNAELFVREVGKTVGHIIAVGRDSALCNAVTDQAHRQELAELEAMLAKLVEEPAPVPEPEPEPIPRSKPTLRQFLERLWLAAMIGCTVHVAIEFAVYAYLLFAN